MSLRRSLSLLVTGIGFASAQGEGDASLFGKDGDPPGKVQQTIKIEAPQVTEEDQHGYNMPKMYMCEACRSIVFHVNATLTKRSGPSKKKLKEWELESVWEEACSDKQYDGYGIKLLGGKNVLSGPALAQEHEKLAAGEASIQMGGDNWKKRLAEECRKLVTDEFEEEMYPMWLDGRLTSSEICVPKHCSADKASPKKKKAKKEKKTEKKEKPKKKPADPEKSKKVSVEGYLAKLARARGEEAAKYTKTRTEQEWVDLFYSGLPQMPGIVPAATKGGDEL